MPQGNIQASVRAVTGTASTYEGDWHALFDLVGIQAGAFNGRLLAWINRQLGTAYTEINGAMAAFAANNGAAGWGGMPGIGVERIADGNFITDPALSGWLAGVSGTATAAWDSANTRIGVLGDGAGGTATWDFPVPTIAGRIYRPSFDTILAAVSFTAGNSRGTTEVFAGQVFNPGDPVAVPLLAQAATTWIRFSKGAAVQAYIDNVSVFGP